MQHAGMRDDLRADMEAQHAEIHSEIIHLRERVTKIETRLDSTVAPPRRRPGRLTAPALSDSDCRLIPALPLQEFLTLFR